MKFKVDEIDSYRLHAAVALALGAQLCTLPNCWYALCRDVSDLTKLPEYEYEDEFLPAWRWDHGGPIIDDHDISLVRNGGLWQAGQDVESSGSGVSFIGPMASDEKPLIAAMRAFVKSKLGDEVELP